MVWQLNKEDHVKYERNPLVAVTIELRFHPILKITSGKGLSDFQEQIREAFPDFSEGKTEIINFRPPNSVETKQEKQFHFRSDERQQAVTLGASSITFESRTHRGHDEFLPHVERVFTALLAVYEAVSPIRLGMRYINVFDKAKIGRELERELDWSDIVNDSYLSLPCGVADLNKTHYISEINAPIDEGFLTLRYGLLRNEVSGETEFRFDIDRYIEGTFDVTECTKNLYSFTDDIFSLFNTVQGPALLDWMKRA